MVQIVRIDTRKVPIKTLERFIVENNIPVTRFSGGRLIAVDQPGRALIRVPDSFDPNKVRAAAENFAGGQRVAGNLQRDPEPEVIEELPPVRTIRPVPTVREAIRIRPRIGATRRVREFVAARQISPQETVSEEQQREKEIEAAITERSSFMAGPLDPFAEQAAQTLVPEQEAPGQIGVVRLAPVREAARETVRFVTTLPQLPGEAIRAPGQIALISESPRLQQQIGREIQERPVTFATGLALTALAPARILGAGTRAMGLQRFRTTPITGIIEETRLTAGITGLSPQRGLAISSFQRERGFATLAPRDIIRDGKILEVTTLRTGQDLTFVGGQIVTRGLETRRIFTGTPTVSRGRPPKQPDLFEFETLGVSSDVFLRGGTGLVGERATARLLSPGRPRPPEDIFRISTARPTRQPRLIIEELGASFRQSSLQQLQALAPPPGRGLSTLTTPRARGRGARPSEQPVIVERIGDFLGLEETAPATIPSQFGRLGIPGIMQRGSQALDIGRGLLQDFGQNLISGRRTKSRTRQRTQQGLGLGLSQRFDDFTSRIGLAAGTRILIPGIDTRQRVRIGIRQRQRSAQRVGTRARTVQRSILNLGLFSPTSFNFGFPLLGGLGEDRERRRRGAKAPRKGRERTRRTRIQADPFSATLQELENVFSGTRFGFVQPRQTRRTGRAFVRRQRQRGLLFTFPTQEQLRRGFRL